LEYPNAYEKRRDAAVSGAVHKTPINNKIAKLSELLATIVHLLVHSPLIYESTDRSREEVAPSSS
jgi:hypothetical protein